jgi:hypothetical protein
MIVIPRELMPAWKGADSTPDTDDRFEPHDLRSNTHYSWACACEGWIATLRFEAGQVLVLNATEDVNNWRWLRFAHEPRPVLLGWVEDDERQMVLDELHRLEDYDWHLLTDDFRLENDELVLMHGASAGGRVEESPQNPYGIACIGDAIPCQLGRGIYAVETTKVTMLVGGYEAEYPMCRFRLLS